MKDVYRIRRFESGEGESPQEKFDRMARERMGGGKSQFWSDQ